MKKSVSVLSIIVAGVMSIAPSHGAQMTPQIQRLLDQKEEKIKKLEECDGKRRGWMIAGISTIGVTAVGVGLNIAQASKSNRLSDEIDTARHDLEVQERHLTEINSQISEKERENAKLECVQQEGMVWKNGQCVPVVSGEKPSDRGIVTAPELDAEPDGKIGDPCGTDNKGKWTEKTDGSNTCSNDNGLVQCECVDETNVTPGGGEKSDKSGDGKKASGKTGGSEKTEESKYTLPSYNPYGESGECKGEYGDRVTKGCTCKSAKGLVSRFNGPKGDNFCECPNGKTWNAGEDKCVDIKKTEKKTEESKYTLPSYNPYGESGDCKGEYGDRVTKGCNCKSAKGLVSRFNGPKGDNFCECPNGKTWDAGEDKCVDIKKTEKKEEETPKYQLPSYSFDYALPVTSGNCAGITQCNNVKTFIPKTEEELKCLKQNCDNIGGKWRQEHKLTYVCGC